MNISIKELECLFHASARFPEVLKHTESFNEKSHLESYLFSEITRFAWDKKANTDGVGIRELSTKLAEELM